MPISHTVAPGECLASIAHLHNRAVKAIWEDPSNDQLRQKRKTPSILLLGDVVTIADVTPKTTAVATGAVHAIRIRREKAMLRVKLLSNGQPIANEPYDLLIDGHAAPSGSTTGAGIVEAQIEPTAMEAVITFAKRAESHTVRRGQLVDGYRHKGISKGQEPGSHGLGR
jgi:hypothetical protein